MDDWGVLKAKKILLQKYPYLSSDLLYIPIEFSNIRSTVCVSKGKILINESLKGKSEDLYLFLLLSSLLMYSFAIEKRVRGFYKVVYYLASAIYANELALKYLEKDVSRDRITRDCNIECFYCYKPLLYPEIKSVDDLFRHSIDEIYQILLKKLANLKDDIDNIIIAFCRKNYDTVEAIKQHIAEKLTHDINSSYAEYFASKIAEHIVAAVERYIHEHLSKKSENILIKLIEKVGKDIILSLAGSSKIHYSNILELNYNLPKLEQIIKNLIIFAIYTPSNEGYFDFTRPSQKILSIRKIIGSTFIPRYVRLKKLRVCFALDTSGSIPDSLYVIFANIIIRILAFLRNVEGYILYFSGNVVKEIPITNLKNIRNALKERVGYGGTEFHYIIEKLKDKNMDYLIVLTDGEFYDESVLEKYYEDLTKFKKILFITTKKIPEIFKKLKNVKIVKINVSLS